MPDSTVFDNGSNDPRLYRKITIKENPERPGCREIRVDGELFPTYTQGAITVTAMRNGGYPDGDGWSFWPLSPDDEWDPQGGTPYGYVVMIPCFVDSVEVEKDWLLAERTLADDDEEVFTV